MIKICKEHLDSVKPYNIRIILTITTVFMTLGFLLLEAYRLIILRYAIIVAMIIAIIIAIIISPKKIYSTISDLINIRK